MLSTLITIAAVYSIVLFTHEYMLKAIHKNALDESKPQNKAAN